ncbi:MAG TPA: hypothetical protein VGJ12_00825 [Gemmatimonadaceae bacterium]
MSGPLAEEYATYFPSGLITPPLAHPSLCDVSEWQTASPAGRTQSCDFAPFTSEKTRVALSDAELWLLQALAIPIMPDARTPTTINPCLIHRSRVMSRSIRSGQAVQL